MNKNFYILLVIFVSCSPRNQIILYKDKQVLTKPNFTNSIQDFNWAYKSENVFDTLIFKGKKEEKINLIINDLEQIPNSEKRIGSPRYAFILEYNKKKDILYFYDFNNENYKNMAYLVQNDITLKDTDNKLKKYLLKHNKKFITKEYYYLPDSNKEYYYLKKHDSLNK